MVRYQSFINPSSPPPSLTRSVILQWHTQVGSSPPEIFVTAAGYAEEADEMAEFVRQIFNREQR